MAVKEVFLRNDMGHLVYDGFVNDPMPAAVWDRIVKNVICKIEYEDMPGMLHYPIHVYYRKTPQNTETLEHCGTKYIVHYPEDFRYDSVILKQWEDYQNRKKRIAL